MSISLHAWRHDERGSQRAAGKVLRSTPSMHGKDRPWRLGGLVGDVTRGGDGSALQGRRRIAGMTLRQQEVLESDVLEVVEPEGLEAEKADVPTVEEAAVPKADVPTVEEPEELKVKGAMLVKIRGMTSEERAAEGWENHPEAIPCVEYDNGAVLYSACQECDRPGTIYASYAGGRWGIDPAGEPYQRTPTRRVTPKWVYPAVALAVLVAGLAAGAVVMLWNVNQDQHGQVREQQRIIQDQRTLMNRQLESQQTIQRIVRSNQSELERSLEHVTRQVEGVAAARNRLRDANAQLRQRNTRLQQRVQQARR